MSKICKEVYVAAIASGIICLKKIAVPVLFDDNSSMNENTDSTKLTTELLFTLDVRIPEQSPRKFEVVDRVLAGIDPRNDLILIDPKVQSKHFLFRKRNNLLSVHYLGRDGETTLNDLPLEKGKLYLLEKGDQLKVGKITIIIRRDSTFLKSPPANAPVKLESPLLEPMEDFLDDAEPEEEVEEDEQNFVEMPRSKSAPPIQNHASKNNSIFDLSTVGLIPYKVYGFFIDISLTYLVLAFILPTLGLMNFVQDFFEPMSSFAAQYIYLHYPAAPAHSLLAMIEFFFSFHCLMVGSSLILGNTPGAFLIGLQRSGIKNFLAARFSAYIYALINIPLLPLLFFDIPLYKGKTIKEMLTFSSRELNSTALFKVSRKAVAPMLILVSFLSPFFLIAPYNAIISHEFWLPPKFMDTHTNHLSSKSTEFGISLSSELNQDIGLLPYFENKKLGLALYDLKSKKTLIMLESDRLSNIEALYKLRYANPLAQPLTRDAELESIALKNTSLKTFDLTLMNLTTGLEQFGPFVANGFLFKEQFLKNFKIADSFFYTDYHPKNPVIKISARLKNAAEEKIFLFTRKTIIEFSLVTPKQPMLLEHLSRSLLAPMRFDQSTEARALSGPKDPQVLEVFDAFERSNYQTLLTYYINEAKKAQQSNNPDWQAFVKKNLLQTKRALFQDNTRSGLTKIIEKSFDDISSTL